MTKPLLWNSGELTINADTTADAASSQEEEGAEAGVAVAGVGAVAIFVLEEGHRTPSSLPFHGACEKTPFLSHLILNTIHLLRQSRDKHRKRSEVQDRGN